jgi:hypothetical protein
MDNHLRESEEVTFSSSQPLESFQRITPQNQQRAPAGFSDESTLQPAHGTVATVHEQTLDYTRDTCRMSNNIR